MSADEATIPLPTEFTFFSTCPPSDTSDPASYPDQVAEVARWSERAGCAGILVYTDNRLLDPWLVAAMVIESTERLSPLVAVQPIYMHPYTVAKMVTSFAFLYGRRMFLNMVAGGFKHDLEALCDQTEHDRRYERLVEYTTVIKELLRGGSPVTLEGDFCRVRNLKLNPALPPELFPGLTMSGSSKAALDAARKLDAVAVQYPRPRHEYQQSRTDHGVATGIRIGVIARPDGAEAWQIARDRFPPDRRGQITHQLAMKVSDSVWHTQLSELAGAPPGGENPYWLVPFENYKTFCPYLVGSYERVAEELGGYVSLGHRTFIFDVPAGEEDFHHIAKAFALAAGQG